ncbi:glutathione S-transferase family protein [uncultured Sphingomonas sp.]|uniref:glutathione S-transferase family protein n=1 Tax=uncultured Sphingomonas sp. TaxID=158754 RepID=UPI0035C9B8FF
MIIYGSGLSPFVRKVLFFAHEKGITVDLQMAGMGAGGEDFAAASPFLKRPGDMAAADAAVRDELPPLFDYLERTIPETGFLVDDRLTLADISVVCPLVNLDHCDVTMDPVRWPRTIAYRNAILGRPGIADLVAGERRLLAA